MAEVDNIKAAVGCLSTVYPQFVQKTLSALTDDILTAVQNFTDPFSALADLELDSLIDDAVALSEQDAFTAMASVATGLTSQYVKRDGQSMLDTLAEEYPNATKRVQQIRNLSGKIVSTGVAMMGLYNDLPYAAGQRMAETIIELDILKRNNLSCLRKHIVQLVNCVITLGNNVENFVDDTLDELEAALAQIDQVQLELGSAQKMVNGAIVFDTEAFDRARAAMAEVSQLLAPDIDGTSILDVAYLATFGSVEPEQTTMESARLVHMAIPSLTNLIEVEASAYYSQVEMINHLISSMGSITDSYKTSASASRVAVERARAINNMKSRLTELQYAIDLAVERQSTTTASRQMLLWASQAKAIIAMMDRVKQLEFTPDEDAVVAAEFNAMLDDLTGLSNEVTAEGIENPAPLRDAALSLSKMATRILADLEAGRSTEAKIATLHAQALSLATSQVNRIDASMSLSVQQKTICERYIALDIGVRGQYDDLLDGMRELGLDRGVDLLGTGGFTDFLESDLESLSYMGAAINCLTDALNGIDDVHTREQVIEIRDDMVARRTNMDVAAADQADQGRTRLLNDLKSQITTIQENQKKVESIVTELQNLLSSIGESVPVELGEFTCFLGNIDHLNVGAGGRLASTLEEYSEHPNAGVVSDDCL